MNNEDRRYMVTGVSLIIMFIVVADDSKPLWLRCIAGIVVLLDMLILVLGAWGRRDD